MERVHRGFVLSMAESLREQAHWWELASQLQRRGDVVSAAHSRERALEWASIHLMLYQLAERCGLPAAELDALARRMADPEELAASLDRMVTEAPSRSHPRVVPVPTAPGGPELGLERGRITLNRRTFTYHPTGNTQPGSVAYILRGSRGAKHLLVRDTEDPRILRPVHPETGEKIPYLSLAFEAGPNHVIPLTEAQAQGLTPAAD